MKANEAHNYVVPKGTTMSTAEPAPTSAKKRTPWFKCPECGANAGIIGKFFCGRLYPHPPPPLRWRFLERGEEILPGDEQGCPGRGNTYFWVNVSTYLMGRSHDPLRRVIRRLIPPTE
jgi:hypothetical protein